ncbi:isatin hydrolase-like [Lineus longissimus]|uniref:isatin hydrolase-like n=1 Tax=Lineus longissimus TaxID=88925 RepID=UPI00315D3DBD
MTINFRNKTDKGYWYETNDFSAAEHGGTHLDAPAHFSKGKWRVSDIPPERFIAEGVVIDIKDKAKKSAVAQLTIDDISAWEKRNGNIPRGSIVFMNSGWQSRWPNKTEYLGTATNDITKLRFPGFHPNAAKWLVTNRDIVGVGVDTASVDFGPSQDFTVHITLSDHSLYIIENVANLDMIPVKGATIYALPMKIAGGSGAPCRIFATWNYTISVKDSILEQKKTEL